ncbi:MAG: GNAT family N-acetyltransferase [Gemmobacter sp.]
MTATLVTPRLLLRPARADDLDALHAVFSHPAAMRYWSHPEHEDIARTRDTLQALIDTPTERVVTRDGTVIGKAGAWRDWEVGFILHPDHWGAGLATEAMAAVIADLFARPDVPALTAETDPRNAGSNAVLRKLGFVQTHAAARTTQWRDEWCDSLYYRLDRPAQ